MPDSFAYFSTATGACHKPDFETILQGRCEDIKELEPSDTREFANSFLQKIEPRYPQYDIEKYRNTVISHSPHAGSSDDMNPFVYVVIATCQNIPDQPLGVGLEQTLIWLFEQKQEYRKPKAN